MTNPASRPYRLANLSIVVMICLSPWAVATARADEPVPLLTVGYQAAAEASLGGPASAPAQLELDRQRMLEDSRWPSLDQMLDPVEASRSQLAEKRGLNLSVDYQTLYQRATESLSDIDDAASGQARVIGNWALTNPEGETPGSLVFILEHRHTLGTDIAPGALAGELGYLGVTGLTFSDTEASLSVAYWQQKLSGGAGLVAGRIDPGDYTDILGHVNPRTTFSNFSILLNPVIPIPDPGFGIAGGSFLGDQFYALGLLSDANGSLTDVDWFPGGSEFFTYGEIGWTPARNQRYLTNIHLGAYHADERSDAGVPDAKGLMVSGNVTFENQVNLFGRVGWSEGDAPIARRAATAGFMWRPGWYDDLFGIAMTVDDPTDPVLGRQTTYEAFYRFDLSDNLAITADVQYLNDPAFSTENTWIYGIRARFNL